MLAMMLIFVSHDYAAAGRLTCCEGHYIIRDNDTVHCVECPDCHAGMQPKFDCVRVVIYNASIDSECVACRSGYYKVLHEYAACVECQKCKDGLYLKKCNMDEDSECV